MPGAKPSARNSQIIDACRAGLSAPKVGAMHGISGKRVLQIIKSLAPETPPFVCGPDVSIVGRRFTRLVVIGLERIAGRRSYWICECDCGARKVVSRVALIKGSTKSCGCFAKARTTTHGRYGTPEWRAWSAMRQRCGAPTHRAYPDYGGRGITVCERWAEFESFYADMGPRPSADHSLDRIDNDGNYGPGNCRWATREEQQNNRRPCVNVQFNGESHTLVEWSRKTGLHPETISARLKSGWTPEDALTTPTGARTRWGTACLKSA